MHDCPAPTLNNRRNIGDHAAHAVSSRDNSEAYLPYSNNFASGLVHHFSADDHLFFFRTGFSLGLASPKQSTRKRSLGCQRQYHSTVRSPTSCDMIVVVWTIELHLKYATIVRRTRSTVPVRMSLGFIGSLYATTRAAS